MQTTTINIGGMTCGGCAKSVTNVLSTLPGMVTAEVDLAKASATITYDPTKLSMDAVTDAVEAAGYEAS